ncbi:hypothetical protein AAC387_Pa02g1003 [Persea americana]
MMEEERVIIKPILIKLGVALTLSFAGGFLYKNHVRIRSFRLLRRPSTDIKIVSGGRPGLKGELCGTQTSLVESRNEEYPQKAVSNANAGFSPNNRSPRDEECFLLPDKESTDEEIMSVEQEITNLRNMVQVLQERERNLEMQMLEYHGLKEKEAIIQELHNRLKINTMEAKFSTLKIESLKAENQTLKTQASEYKRVVTELEITKAKSKLLKRKMKSEVKQANQQLFDLQKKVMKLEDREHEPSFNDADTQEKLKRLKDLEDKLSELSMENSRLQHEKSELDKKLEFTQFLASALECPEDRVLEEAKQLRQVNHDLEQELDRLRMDHSLGVEELVYLRWVNACLRCKLRNNQTPSRKTAAMNISKTLSARSEQKVEQLILDNAISGQDENNIGPVDFHSGYCSSSRASELTETGDIDDHSISNSSNNRTSSSNKQRFFSKFKRIFSGKQDHHSNKRISPVGRTSMSSITSRKVSSSTGSLDDIGGPCSDSVSCISVEHTATNLHMPEAKLFHDSSIPATRRSETQANNIKRQSQSESTPRISLDIHRLANINIEELKEFRGYERRASDIGSPYSCKALLSRDGSATDFSHHDRYLELELKRFARSLKSAHEKARRRFT